MKKKMTVREFDKFLDTQAISEIILYYQNQPAGHELYPLGLNLSFPTIRTSLYPDAVYLQDGGNTVTFFGVKHANVDTEKSVLGTVVNLFCESLGKEHIYTLLLKVR